MFKFITDNIQRNKVILINMVVTFVQGFLAVWGTNGFKTDKVVLGASIAAGASVVWNTILKPALKQYTELYSK